MSVRRKLFLAMASFIAAMGVLFVLLTIFVVQGVIREWIDVDRSREIEALLGRFEAYYEEHNGSWEGVNRLDTAPDRIDRPDLGIMLTSASNEVLYSYGDEDKEIVTRLGIRSVVRFGEDTAGFLYYYDREVGNISKVKLGVSSSVTFLLLAGSLLFIAVSLLVAYRLSNRVTAPLRELVPVIERLGSGQLGVQAPVVSADEYGKVALAFNAMSAQILKAEEARRTLVADVAHELRTPITIIRGKLELIQQSGESVEPERLLPLQDELIRLSRLVDDLHVLSLAEARKLPLERKPVKVSELLQRVIGHIAADSGNKGIAVTLHRPNNEPLVLADANRIIQVFLNLLVNAVRYTPTGGAVTVKLEEQAVHAGQPDAVRVTIEDTGTGIAPEHLPFLFDRFYRTDEARARNSGGAGLGLAIAKELVLAHDGAIDVQSSPGRGTAFTVTLPAMRPAAAKSD
ncbi:sensor histidine kinase [Paenibacillus thermotolerans]|uniref:sensor histidine kinase n=1 Tax=Paenibacillus thermotolerans TaxID=3027807 RepID=UPI002367A27C|nr:MULTISPECIES: ATP-binding protein [unclassified Paenibacillus]